MIFCRTLVHEKIPMLAKSALLSLFAFSALGQTADDLAAKYRSLSAYEVRPGILMTADYAEDGQACEIVLQRYYSQNQTDADSIIPAKMEEQLIDELAPQSERGAATSKWLRNSFVAGGVMHTERDFANMLIVIDGTYSCTQEQSSGEPNCGHGGTRVITIHWKKRMCASKPTRADSKKTHSNNNMENLKAARVKPSH